MVDMISTESNVIDLKKLPPDLQERIRNYAVLDILKDQAKESIKAKQINVEKYLEQWIATKASVKTQVTYRKAIQGLFAYLEIIGIEHPLLIRAEHVDQYILELKNTLKPNSIRLKISACSSFYSILKRYRYIKVNPFYNSALPKKEYKKAVQTDQNRTIPIMNDKEYKTIMKQLKDNTRIHVKGKHASARNIRDSALALIPAVHFMAVYGLRVGAIPTIEIKEDVFTYSTKGNASYSQALKPETASVIRAHGKQFKGYVIPTIQASVKRLTRGLNDKGQIRYAYSSHDFRHYFANKFYTETKDIVALKNILGHASINVTDIYLQSIGIK